MPGTHIPWTSQDYKVQQEDNCNIDSFDMLAGLAKNYHDGIARFVASMNPGKGVESALCLSGISLLEELKLSRQSSKLRRALRCLQALAAGASSNAAFKELPVWTNHLSETYTLEMPAGNVRQALAADANGLL